MVLMECALECLNDDNSDRRDLARKVVAGSFNITTAALAILAEKGMKTLVDALDDSPAEPVQGGAKLSMKAPDLMADQITDAAIQKALMPDQKDKAQGVFHKLAVAKV